MGSSQAENKNLTPLVKLAVHRLPQAFFYLYRFPLCLKVQESENLVVLEKRVGIWKFLPWCISVFFVSGITGGGSCAYVVASFVFKFRFNSTLRIHSLHCILAMGLESVLMSEITSAVIIFRFPELILAFNRIAELERQCKFSILRGTT